MRKFNLILFSFLFVLSASCKEKEIIASENPDGENPNIGLAVNLNNTLEIGIGERAVLTPVFDENAKKLNFNWTSDNNDATILKTEKDFSVSLMGKQEGETNLTIESSDKKITATCKVKVSKKTIKILAIGNSFSEDAVQNYLYDLAKAEGFEVIIGNMYIGGCTLETHLKNALNDLPAYDYRKIVNGKLTKTAAMTLAKALADEDWNYISFQQASPNSGQYSTYEKDLPQLVLYVKRRAAKATFMLHQTWAYAQNSTHSGFANYNRDQMTMYNAIVDANKRAAELTKIDMIIPSGTAIQNGRTSVIGDAFCRDGYHLETTYGRYTAACTWFEKIFDKDVTNNKYSPETITPFYKKISQYAAHYAVLKPFEVTGMYDFFDEAVNGNINATRICLRLVGEQNLW